MRHFCIMVKHSARPCPRSLYTVMMYFTGLSCMDCTQQLLQHLQVIQGAGGWSVFHRKENTDCTARFMIGFAVVSANDDPAPVVVIEAPMLRTPVQG